MTWRRPWIDTLVTLSSFSSFASAMSTSPQIVSSVGWSRICCVYEFHFMLIFEFFALFHSLREKRRERELFLSGKATPPPAMVCIIVYSKKLLWKQALLKSLHCPNWPCTNPPKNLGTGQTVLITVHQTGANRQAASDPGKDRSDRREKRKQEEVVCWKQVKFS